MGQLSGAAEDQVHRPLLGPATLHGLLNNGQRMFGQQLQNTNELSRASMGPVLLLQVYAELVEDGRQSPILEDCGVIEVGGLAAQHR